MSQSNQVGRGGREGLSEKGLTKTKIQYKKRKYSKYNFNCWLRNRLKKTRMQ
jgi:hypothetical protein